MRNSEDRFSRSYGNPSTEDTCGCQPIWNKANLSVRQVEAKPLQHCDAASPPGGTLRGCRGVIATAHVFDVMTLRRCDIATLQGAARVFASSHGWNEICVPALLAQWPFLGHMRIDLGQVYPHHLPSAPWMPGHDASLWPSFACVAASALCQR